MPSRPRLILLALVHGAAHELDCLLVLRRLSPELRPHRASSARLQSAWLCPGSARRDQHVPVLRRVRQSLQFVDSGIGLAKSASSFGMRKNNGPFARKFLQRRIGFLPGGLVFFSVRRASMICASTSTSAKDRDPKSAAKPQPFPVSCPLLPACAARPRSIVFRWSFSLWSIVFLRVVQQSLHAPRSLPASSPEPQQFHFRVAYFRTVVDRAGLGQRVAGGRKIVLPFQQFGDLKLQRHVLRIVGGQFLECRQRLIEPPAA